jgi:dTDP-4-dehydrorhamnose 3,5-epimerase
MKLEKTSIPGCLNIVPDVHQDDRGIFVKTVHKDIFNQRGLENFYVEQYYSVSKKGVLRGMHFQLPPYHHTKLVYCISGEVMDVVIDLRVGSPTYGNHAIFNLNSDLANIIYIPQGLAHGFFTLSNSATLVYNVSTSYDAKYDSGIHWNSAGIAWPNNKPLLSKRDKSFVALENFNSPFLYIKNQDE